MVKLDKVDRKIIDLLVEDGSLAYTRIARKIKKNRNTVQYKINRLIKLGVITGFETQLNYKALGFKQCMFYFNFIRFDESNKGEIFDYFVKYPYTRWVGEYFSKYHARISIVVRDDEHLEQVARDFEDYFKGNLREMKFLLVADIIKSKNIVAVSDRPWGRRTGVLRLDAKDIDILKEVSLSPRTPLLSLSQKTGLSVEGVRKKVNRLKEQNVITGTTLMFDKKKLNKNIWCICLVKFNNFGQIKSRISRVIGVDPKVGVTLATLGDWDAEFTILSKDLDDLKDTINRLVNQFGESLKSYESLLIFNSYKYPKVPVGIFDDLKKAILSKP